MLQSNLIPLLLHDFIALTSARVFSMAFPKNYPFRVLILFPRSLHVVHALNYVMCSAVNGNFMLHWTYSNNKPIFNMTCKATGYCAVAFTEPATCRNMEMYDIAAGFFVGSITTQQFNNHTSTSMTTY